MEPSEREQAWVKCNAENLQLLSRKLQEAQNLMSKDVTDIRMRSDAANKELLELDAEKSHLEEVLEKKQETLRVLRLQRYKEGSVKHRRQQLLDGHNHRIQDLSSKIQTEHDKRRQLRMEFERRLEEFSEKHKTLWEFHNERRLALEITRMEDTKRQLQNEVMEEHRRLNEMLDTSATEGPARTTDSTFRLSAEAAVKLFDEENACARSRLGAASVYQSRVQESHARLREEMEAAEVGLADASAEGAPGPPGLTLLARPQGQEDPTHTS